MTREDDRKALQDALARCFPDDGRFLSPHAVRVLGEFRKHCETERRSPPRDHEGRVDVNELLFIEGKRAAFQWLRDKIFENRKGIENEDWL
ncbi:MAG: hypothetical protein AAFW46_19075, partial [Pseudomonadota bacterium]